MAAIAYITCIPGNFLMAYLGDTVGRKITLLFISATSAVRFDSSFFFFDFYYSN